MDKKVKPKNALLKKYLNKKKNKDDLEEPEEISPEIVEIQRAKRRERRSTILGNIDGTLTDEFL